MHFAYPPRKSSDPPKFMPRPSRITIPTFRRNRLKLIALGILAFLAVAYLFARSGSRRDPNSTPRQPSGDPPVVIVTVLDENMYPKEYIDTIKENRVLYAEKHGFKTFFPKVGDYDLNGAPMSWAKVVSVRHTLTKFPDCTYVWFLEQDAFIMNGQGRVDEHIMKPSRMDALMMKDHSVVPPDSIIKTFAHLKGKDVDFVLTQDKDGVSSGSFIVRNGEWARFFLETWFDPIYRGYNFQKADTHALEHIIQWHPTILSKLAIVPQRAINSYSNDAAGEQYEDGDLVVRFAGCSKVAVKSCESDAARFVDKWRKSMKGS